jgi:molecular chaperone DnaJ
MLRVREQGEKIEDGKPGDLYVKIYVIPHPFLVKDGFNLVMQNKIKLSEAIEGKSLELDILDEKITVKIPAGINNGEVLRVKNKGVPSGKNRGNLLIKINIDMPHKMSSKVKEAIKILKEEGY